MKTLNDEALPNSGNVQLDGPMPGRPTGGTRLALGLGLWLRLALGLGLWVLLRLWLGLWLELADLLAPLDADVDNG